MSAAVLRDAALMRERAKAAIPALGGLTCETSMRRKWMLMLSEGGSDDERVVAKFADDDEADYFASWHPVVALAVADWLDREADVDAVLKSAGARGKTAKSHCVKVARAYLGAAP